MFIKKNVTKNRETGKTYEYLHLVESARMEIGPRQKFLLNLGSLDIPESQWKSLAKRIEDILTGTDSFIELDGTVEKAARHAAGKIFKMRAEENQSLKIRDYRMADLSSVSAEEARTLGPEYVCHAVWDELKLGEFFASHGVSQTILPVMEALIVGRLIDAGNELRIREWVTKSSGLYELTGEPRSGSLNTFYRATDRLLTLKEDLERHLAKRERDLFSLKEDYCFLDLTNTYFEGKCQKNGKARYGRSKEKRTDCKIVTLGLVVDEEGFAKASRLFEGNRNETTTLTAMIEEMEKTRKNQGPKTIITDAGLVSEENLKWIRERKDHYIAVNRGQAGFAYDLQDMKTIRKDEKKGIEIRIKRYEQTGEAYIVCHSRKKAEKEKSMRTRIEGLFVSRLEYLRDGLGKPRREQKLVRLTERLGRLKEKYPAIAKLYDVEIVPEEKTGDNVKTLKAKSISWERNDRYEPESEQDGSYILRTDRTDLTDEEIWSIYNMLRRIEHSFLCMKSHLGLRPNFHRLEGRMDAHMFISVVAYHILHAIEYKLKKTGDRRTWETVKNELRSHARVTVGLDYKEEDGRIGRRLLRLTTRPEPSQIEIYRALGLSETPLSGKTIFNSG